MASVTASSEIPYGTPGNKVNIAIWMCFITAGFAVVCKILTRIPAANRLLRIDHYHLDDSMCFLTIVRVGKVVKNQPLSSHSYSPQCKLSWSRNK